VKPGLSKLINITALAGACLNSHRTDIINSRAWFGSTTAKQEHKSNYNIAPKLNLIFLKFDV